MRLLIDSVPCGSPGIIAVRDDLSRALGQRAPEGSEAVLLAASEVPENGAGKLRIIRHAAPAGNWAGRWMWYQRSLPALAEQLQADVLYSMGSIVSSVLGRRLPTVTNINNMLPFMPVAAASYPALSLTRVRVQTLRRVYIRSMRLADCVVLHSQHALNMVSKYAPDVASKTFVALTGVPGSLGFSPAAPPAHPYQGRPYLLYFSLFYAYKNHLRVLESYKRCLASQSDVPDLVLIGRADEPGYVQQVVDGIAKLGLEGRVRYVGPIERADVASWLHHAVVNIFASTCETNPVTVAEILGAGGALACSGVPPMPEVAGVAAA